MLLLDFFVDTVPKPNLVPQEVPPPMQYEHGDAMEQNEWFHEGLKGFHKHLDQTHGL
jgi:hypothetical protein